jgi:hypothetical protein
MAKRGYGQSAVYLKGVCHVLPPVLDRTPCSEQGRVRRLGPAVDVGLRVPRPHRGECRGDSFHCRRQIFFSVHADILRRSRPSRRKNSADSTCVSSLGSSVLLQRRCWSHRSTVSGRQPTRLMELAG